VGAHGGMNTDVLPVISGKGEKLKRLSRGVVERLRREHVQCLDALVLYIYKVRI